MLENYWIARKLLLLAVILLLSESTNSVIEWPSMRKQVFRGLLTYVRLFDVVE